MQGNSNFYQFDTQNILVNELADAIATLLSRGITENGKASLAVSGGSTPVALFKKLSTLSIPWEQVHISLVDERWVDAEDNDSNEKLVRDFLLQNNAAVAPFTGMKNKAATAGEGAEECSKNLALLPQPYDVLILGMGGDGHTASLFPGADKLKEATDMQSGKRCMGIAPLSAPHERMTLTLPAILNSRQLILHITGIEKKTVLETAMEQGPLEEYPIRFILNQNVTPLSIYWAE